MQRNLVLVKKILQTIDQADGKTIGIDIMLGYSPDNLAFHKTLLVEVGLIRAVELKMMQEYAMEWPGYEYLRVISQDDHKKPNDPDYMYSTAVIEAGHDRAIQAGLWRMTASTMKKPWWKFW